MWFIMHPTLFYGYYFGFAALHGGAKEDVLFQVFVVVTIHIPLPGTLRLDKRGKEGL